MDVQRQKELPKFHLLFNVVTQENEKVTKGSTAERFAVTKHFTRLMLFKNVMCFYCACEII